MLSLMQFRTGRWHYCRLRVYFEQLDVCMADLSIPVGLLLRLCISNLIGCRY